MTATHEADWFFEWADVNEVHINRSTEGKKALADKTKVLKIQQVKKPTNLCRAESLEQRNLYGTDWAAGFSLQCLNRIVWLYFLQFNIS